VIINKLKTNYNAIKIHICNSEYQWNIPELTSDIKNGIYDVQEMANMNYNRSLYNYKLKMMIVKIDPWKCKKIQLENYTHETILRQKYVTDYNNEHEKRVRFWNTYIHPLFTPQGSISKRSWFRQQTNVWSITHPPKAYHRNQHMNMRWNQEWAIIIDTVKNNRKRN